MLAQRAGREGGGERRTSSTSLRSARSPAQSSIRLIVRSLLSGGLICQSLEPAGFGGGIGTRTPEWPWMGDMRRTSLALRCSCCG